MQSPQFSLLLCWAMCALPFPAVKRTVPLVEGIYTVGRKGSSISFAEDRSVSRRHAEIRVGPLTGSDPSKQPVWIKDVGSKLKTFVNNEDTAEANKEVALKDEDRVRVGTASSVCRLRFQELRLCGTQLSKEDKLELKGLAKKAGGKVVAKWDLRCTHLITPASFNIVTEKLVLAVAQVKPVVHVQWLKTLIDRSTAKPLRATPDTAAFHPVVLRGKATIVVKNDPSHRTHLAGNFFVALHEDAVFETMVENTGAVLCRAYTMSESDFKDQNWRELVAGRKDHYLQPLPDEPIPPEIAATVAVRGRVLEGIGMKATTKRQLAEAVVYMQPLVSLDEAIRTSNSGAVAGLGQTASQAWGQSQSLVSEALQEPPQASTLRAHAATAAAGSGMPRLTAFRTPPRSVHDTAAPAQATAALPPPAPIPSKASAKPAVAVKVDCKARAESVNTGGDGWVGESARRGGRPQSQVAIKKEFGEPAEEELELGRMVGGSGSGAPNVMEVTEAKGDEDRAGKESLSSGSRGGKDDKGIFQRKARDGGGRADQMEAGAGAVTGGGVSREELEERARVGIDASGKGERRPKRNIMGEGAPGRKEDDENKNEHEEMRNMVNEAKQQQQQQQQQQPKLNEIQDSDQQEPQTHGKRGRAASSTPPPRAAKKASRSSALSTAVECSSRDAASQEEKRSQSGSSQPRLPTNSAEDGWLSTRRSENRRKGAKSEAVERDGTLGKDAMNEEFEEEQAPLEAAITERRKLVVEASARIALHAYSSTKYADNKGHCLSVPNFKRFKKNTVMFGGDGLGVYFPKSLLRSTVPKESERELVLQAEQHQLEEEEADAERLFTQGSRGVASRAPRGRTRRR